MLSSRILKLAEDIITDYRELKLVETLQMASQCASRNLQPSNFLSFSKQVHDIGQVAVTGSRGISYPQEVKDFLLKSNYNIVLPENIGRFLSDGFNGDINYTPSSSEVNHRISASNIFLNDLNSLTVTLKKLNTQPVIIPSNLISVDFLVTRNSFENETKRFFKIQDDFSSILSCLNELFGNVNPPLLVYTSTTDPVTAFAVYAGTAYTVIKIFNGILQIARNGVELYRAIKIVREQKISEAIVQQAVQSADVTIKAQIENLIKSQVSIIVSDIDDGRKNELTVAINIRCAGLVTLVAEGCSIGISIESLPALKGLKIDKIVEGQPSFVQLVSDTRKNEAQTRSAITIAGGAENLKLTYDYDVSALK